MRSTTCLGAILLLATAGCGKEAEKELADVKATLATLRGELADYKAAKEREITDLKAQLEQKTKELAEAEKGRLDQAADFAATAGAQIESLQESLMAEAKKAAEAMQRADALAKARDKLQSELSQVKTALADQAAKVDSLTAELAKLKKFLGR